MRMKSFSAVIASALLLSAGAAAAQPTPPPEGTTPPAEPPAEPLPAEPAPVEPAPPPLASEPDPGEKPAHAPEPAAAGTTLAPKLSGHVAATYNYNFMDPVGGLTPLVFYTAKHNSFLLNQAHLALSGADDRIAYAVEVDAGTDALVDNGGLSYFDLQEAWVSYTAESGIGFKAGKFATYQGIEVIESPANPTISRGFLFNLAEPFTHVGAVATYKASDMLDFAVGAINGWDLIVDNNDNKMIVAKVGVTQDTFGLTVSGHVGKQTGNQDLLANLDATAVIKSEQLDIWVQGNVGWTEIGDDETAMWYGAGVQPVFRLDDKTTLCGRLEALIDADGFRTNVIDGVNLINVSVTPAYKVHDQVQVRAEGRLDFASEDVFVDNDGEAGALQAVVLGEVIVSF